MLHTAPQVKVTGVAWLCNLEGIVVDAAYFGLADRRNQDQGRQLADALETPDRNKVLLMLESSRRAGASYGWEIGMELAGAVTTFHFAACKLDDRLIVVASSNRSGINQVNRQVSTVWPDTFAALDAAWQQNLYQIACEAHRDSRSFDELSRMNNELSAMHRKLIRSETRLRVNDERYRSLLQTVPYGVQRNDLAGRITFANSAHGRILGYAPEEIVGRHIWDFEVDQDRRESSRRFFFEIVRQQPGVTPVITQNRTQDGRVIDVRVDWNYERDDHGKLIGFVSTIFDITDIRKAQQERDAAQRALLDQKEREAGLVQQELERVKRELMDSTRLATLGEIAGQIAHDLRNPLGSVRNSAYYLKCELRDNDELQEFVEIIEGEVQTCDTIIRNLLEVTRPSEPALQDVNLIEVVQAAFRRLHAPPGVQFKLETSKDPFYIDFDPVQCRQVFDNLLSNARHAVKREGWIEVTLASPGQHAEVRVRDSGPGVPAELRENIFDSLFTTKAKGTGLGLAICRQVVERHKGTIELEAEQDGAGASFLIRIPKQS